MSGVPATFWSSPIRYLRWASYEKPAIFWSVVVGAMGPVSLLVVPPMRRWAGDETPKMIPLTYPGECRLKMSNSPTMGEVQIVWLGRAWVMHGRLRGEMEIEGAAGLWRV